MRKNRAIPWAIIAMFLTLTVPAGGREGMPALQETPPASSGRVRKIFQLKYIEPSRLTDLLHQIFVTLPAVDDRMKVLIVQDTPAKVEAVEEIVKTLDVPQAPTKNVEIKAYFLAATPQQAPTTDLPSELNEVIAQLRKTFNFQAFQLVGTAAIRTQDNESASVRGAVGVSGIFNLSFQRLNLISGEGSPSLHLTNLDFSVSTPDPSHDAKGETEDGNNLYVTPAKIHTTIDVPAGEKVVVGRTSIPFPNRAVFLILTGKVVD